MQARNPWPLLVMVLVAGFLALSAWSFHRAARDASAVIDANYYSHGLRYNQTLLEKTAASALGWRAAASLAGRRLQVTLTDSAQQPIAAASGTLTLRGGTRGEMLRLALTEDPGGVYHGTLPHDLRGELTVQIDFEQGGARLSQRLLLSLP